MSNKIDQLINEYSEFRNRFQAQAQDLFKDCVKDLFAAVPEITVIKWTQYTPYFNDGEACVFRVGSPTFSNAADPDNVSAWGELSDENEGEWAFEGNYGMPDALKNDMDKFRAVRDFSAIVDNGEMEEVFEAMFGDHVMVTITRDGIDVSDYEHD